MFLNYLKIAWRNLLKNRYYSLVNILGLSAGILFAMVISVYSWSELQVNAALRNPEQQYILQSRWISPDMGNELVTIGPLAKALYEEYPSLVANFYRFDGVTSNVSKGDKHFRESFQIGDSTLLRMYGFSLLHGDASSALADPFSLVITEEAAVKYFGKTDAVGETVSIENFSGEKHDFMIRGILKDHTRNSVSSLLDDKETQFYTSIEASRFFGREMTSWESPHVASYIELQKGVKPEQLSGPIKQLMKKNSSEYFNANLTQYLVPLKSYYLNKDNGLVKRMIYVLSFIALFILLMAVVNFVNMSVGHSTTRLKEIGIRKVLGGIRKQMILQFLTESMVMVFLATLFALVSYTLSRNYFSGVLGKALPELTAFPPGFMFLPLALIVFVGFLSGIYPALVLSGFKTVDSLKGKLTTVKEKIWLRKALVGFQFSIASIVLIGAIIVTQQINYFFGKNLGYNKEFIISAQVPRDWSAAGVSRMENIRAQLATLPQVSNVSLSFEIPDGRNSGGAAVYRAGADSTSAISTEFLNTDGHFASTFGIPLRAGNFFSPTGELHDSAAVVINETEAKALGWSQPEEAIGRQVKIAGSEQLYTIAGVTSDFHFGSMQQSVPPIIFVHVGNSTIFRYLSVKLKPGDISNSLEAIQKKWSALMPGAPFEYKFMDETLRKLYKTEIQLRKASYTAFLLAMVIVMLGVLGLVAMSIQRRTKEIGIRKVLGSSVTGIITLFMKEFLVITLIAACVAFPIAYYIMQHWLNGYVYRIQITALPFIIAIITLGFITALLIGIQTMKAALSNPVNSLKTE